jgi:hypothetical protein
LRMTEDEEQVTRTPLAAMRLARRSMGVDVAMARVADNEDVDVRRDLLSHGGVRV